MVFAEAKPTENGVPIRPPSVANLQVDSTDRRSFSTLGAPYNAGFSTFSLPVNTQSPFDFVIARPNSILNGFFTRVANTELVLEWDCANVQGGIANPNNRLSVIVSTVGAGAGTVASNLTNIPFTLPSGYYNGSQVVDFFLAAANNISSSTGVAWNWTNVTSNTNAPTANYYLTAVSTNTGANPGPPIPFAFNYTTLAKQMNFLNRTSASTITTPQYALDLNPVNPDLRLFRYIDFTSPTLTNNQNVKDATTNTDVVNSLARWYFAWGGQSQDSTTNVDKYGFPIYQGYRPFIERREFSTPKQIKWETNIPIGQISFQVYGEQFPSDTFLNANYQLLTSRNVRSFNTNYMMTLQVSEV